eukprot:TRINITY_DN7986_c0_g4_i1.p1 TRINITY_DN7986_c0_g4~~TRINITY_DN7986_c0_g4_i1.p1  ORF type:complete len:637 (+),score=109.09 TRINITY_DN7986_c0_g4_i1:31-1911(+)
MDPLEGLRGSLQKLLNPWTFLPLDIITLPDNVTTSNDVKSFFKLLSISNTDALQSLYAAKITTVEQLLNLNAQDLNALGFSDFERNLVMGQARRLTKRKQVDLSELVLSVESKQGVLWTYKEGAKYVPFCKEDNQKIEDAYNRGIVEVQVTRPPFEGGYTWKVNLHAKKMTAYKNDKLCEFLLYPVAQRYYDLTTKFQQLEQLCEAAFKGDEATFFHLVKNFQKELKWLKNSRGSTVLYSACRGKGTMKIIVELVKHRKLPISSAQGTNDSSPLHAAFFANRDDITAYLLCNPCDINFKNSHGYSAADEAKSNAKIMPILKAYQEPTNRLQALNPFIPRTSAKIQLKALEGHNFSDKDEFRFFVRELDSAVDITHPMVHYVSEVHGNLDMQSLKESQFVLIRSAALVLICIEIITEKGVHKVGSHSINLWEGNLTRKSFSVKSTTTGEKYDLKITLKVKLIEEVNFQKLINKRSQVFTPFTLSEETIISFYTKIQSFQLPLGQSNKLFKSSKKIEKLFQNYIEKNLELPPNIYIKKLNIKKDYSVPFNQLSLETKYQHLVSLDYCVGYFKGYHNETHPSKPFDAFFRENIIIHLEKFLPLIVPSTHYNSSLTLPKFCIGLVSFIQK